MRYKYLTGLILIQALALFSQDSIYGQNWRFEPYFSAKLAINTVDDNGDASPFSTFNKFKENAFASPIALGLEYRLKEEWGIAMTLSFNQFQPNGEDVINLNLVDRNINYFALDIHAKLYLDDLLSFLKYKRVDWYDIYTSGGFAYFQEKPELNKSALAAVFGLGTNVWVTEKLAVNLEGLAKFSGGDTGNHAQFLFGVQYNFGFK